MPAAPLPATERARLTDLRALDILDTAPEQAYDDIVGLAVHVMRSPMAAISLVDWDREWFKAKVGLKLIDTPRVSAFSAYAIASSDDVFVVEDAFRDSRFHKNPLVSRASVRFFAGAPIHSPSGRVVGTLNVYDVVARQLTESERTSLIALARQVEGQLANRKQDQELQSADLVLALYQRRLARSDERLTEALAATKTEATVDELTGLVNRLGMSARLDQELQRLDRYGHPLTIAMVEVDGFRAYAEAHGEKAAEAALRTVSNVLSDRARTSDVVARYGRQEFLIIFSGTGADGALAVTDRVRAALKAESTPGQAVTVSVGLAHAKPGVASEDLIAEADAALHRAKSKGRSRAEVTVTTGVSPWVGLKTQLHAV